MMTNFYISLINVSPTYNVLHTDVSIYDDIHYTHTDRNKGRKLSTFPTASAEILSSKVLVCNSEMEKSIKSYSRIKRKRK